MKRINKTKNVKRRLKKNTKISSTIMEFKKTIRALKQGSQALELKCRRLEEENNNLANLYVASYQLHSTVDFKETLRVLLEIVTNLIGADKLAIMLVDDRSKRLVPKAVEGINLDAAQGTKVGQGIIGNVAATGESYFKASHQDGKGHDVKTPMICIPLKVENRVIGIIAVYSLLAHKRELSNIDYELFNLLAGPAASAIHLSMRLSNASELLDSNDSSLELYKGVPRSGSKKSDEK